MGQKVHPNGIRVGVIKDWNSKWYADSKNYSDYLVEDYKIRKYVKQKLCKCLYLSSKDGNSIGSGLQLRL